MPSENRRENLMTSRSGLAVAAAGALGIGVATLLAVRRMRRIRSMTMIEHDFAKHGPLPLPAAHPAEVGLCPERLEHITKWSDRWVASGKVPGMITVIARRGKVVYLHASGCADVEQEKPFQVRQAKAPASLLPYTLRSLLTRTSPSPDQHHRAWLLDDQVRDVGGCDEAVRTRPLPARRGALRNGR